MLIIIGLLVAGVIGGGVSLIESARSRALMNEIMGWERGIFSFKALKDRLSGDVKSYGTFGVYDNYDNSNLSAKPYYKYKASNFSESALKKYRETAGEGAIPDEIAAPFLELSLEEPTMTMLS